MWWYFIPGTILGILPGPLGQLPAQSTP